MLLREHTTSKSTRSLVEAKDPWWCNATAAHRRQKRHRHLKLIFFADGAHFYTYFHFRCRRRRKKHGGPLVQLRQQERRTVRRRREQRARRCTRWCVYVCRVYPVTFDGRSLFRGMVYITTRSACALSNWCPAGSVLHIGWRTTGRFRERAYQHASRLQWSAWLSVVGISIHISLPLDECRGFSDWGEGKGKMGKC